MKKRLAVAMIAFSIANGFLAFGQKKDHQLAEEPLLVCPEECCTSEHRPPADCCRDAKLCCE